MGGFSDNPDTQLMIELARLEVDDSTRKAMRAFFATLDAEKKARVLSILGSEDKDMARLIVATVPKMQAALQRKGRSLKEVIQSASSSFFGSSS